MHMTSAAHLLNEDRPDYERILDEALHLVLDDADASSGSPLNAEQLRTMALAASDAIEATADEEYQAYRTLRAEMREAARESARARDSRSFGYAAMGVTDTGSGAGLFAVIAVLTPMLAGAAAVIFLIIGYALRAVSPEPGIAAPLRTAGWFFGGVTAAAIVFGAIGLLLTALRDGSSAIHDTPEAMPPEVTRAREIWHDALLTRGLLPFLDDALSAAQATASAANAPTAGATTGAATGATTSGQGPGSGVSAARMPRLGYSRPDFSSPQDPQATTPRFSSPDFSSPDFGGPEHRS